MAMPTESQSNIPLAQPVFLGNCTTRDLAHIRRGIFTIALGVAKYWRPHKNP